MKRPALDALITSKALSLMVGHGDAIDLIPDQEMDGAVIKNVCAKVSTELSDEIDSICGLLGIRKRSFIECAFIEAVEKAKAILDAEGVWEHLEEDRLAREARAAKREASK